MTKILLLALLFAGCERPPSSCTKVRKFWITGSHDKADWNEVVSIEDGCK